jgi:hypothetical protein
VYWKGSIHKRYNKSVGKLAQAVNLDRHERVECDLTKNPAVKGKMGCSHAVDFYVQNKELDDVLFAQRGKKKQVKKLK